MTADLDPENDQSHALPVDGRPVLTPLTDLFHNQNGQVIHLPERLAQFYGRLWFPAHPGRPHVITNFVSSMDGVVSLSTPGHEGGGDISGFYPADQAVMGLLRACADAVIVGASQLRHPPGTIWLPNSIYPEFADAYQQLRRASGKTAEPAQIVVTATGELDLSLPIFRQQRATVTILTTRAGSAFIQRRGLPSHVDLRVAAEVGPIPAPAILSVLADRYPTGLLLIEGGPHLTRYFIEAQLLDELFLTVAPQIAGRDADLIRPGFTYGKTFAPENPRWGNLRGLKRSGSYLFLRYQLTE